MAAKKNSSETLSFHPFENLKQTIEKKGIKLSHRPAMYERDKSVNDEDLFVDAMKEVREIKEFRNMPVTQGKLQPLRKGDNSDKETLKILADIACGRRPIKIEDTQEYIEWLNPKYRAAYRGDIVKRLHEGRFSIQDTLDLHGFVAEDAVTELRRFIKDVLSRGLRCIKIIHGRGLRSPKGPVLKNTVSRLLSCSYRKHIIAFVTARQCDSGLGAIYVLIKSI
ncbi:MAG: Smr/MutS family protein [Nitrospirae bacterium]|nr:Smr/MutS family protein [Nitrospirota bacterium]